MELELGLKFTRVADEFTSDFQITKDRAGPLFLSRETDSMFVLTAHLKGFSCLETYTHLYSVLEYNKDDGLKDGEAGELFSPPIHDRVEAETSKEDLKKRLNMERLRRGNTSLVGKQAKCAFPLLLVRLYFYRSWYL